MRNNWLNYLLLACGWLLAGGAARAQAPGTYGPGSAPAPADQPEMADALRASGKIYVVVAVIVIILLGLLLYLIRLDRKVARLEREVA